MSRLLIRVWAGVVVVVAFAAGWLAYLDQGNRRDVASHAAALVAAQDEVPRVLSYTAATIDQDMAQAQRVVTGPFKRELAGLVTSTIRPAATEQQITTSAVVTDAGLVRSVSDREVKVLLFVNQTTTSRAQPQPRQDGSRLQVTMTKVGERWLISAIEPL